MNSPPPPLVNMTEVHHQGINNAQAPKLLGLAHDLSLNKPIFFIVISSVPVEDTPMPIKTSMGAIRETTKTH